MTHEIRKTEDGGHAVTDSTGRIATLNQGGSLTMGEGFSSAAQARQAAKDSGLDVKGDSRAQGGTGGGGASAAAKKRAARKT